MRITTILIAIYFAIISSCGIVQANTDRPQMHPVNAAIDGTKHGARNPAVTQANIDRTICIPNWSDSVRPPTSYTNGLKRKEMLSLNIDWDSRKLFEEDHWISIGIGGDPADPHNLVLMSFLGACNAHNKDSLEGTLHRMVCAKPKPKITLAQAQYEMKADWVASYNLHVASAKYHRPKLVCK